MAERHEHRVRWRREGRPPRTQIIQTERGARQKAERLVAIDRELSGEDDWPGAMDPFGPEKHPLEGMPPLLAPPTIERRTVGEWEPMPDD